MRFENDVINQILNAYKPMWSLNHPICLMGWDFETYMPKKGMEERGVAELPNIELVKGDISIH